MAAYHGHMAPHAKHSSQKNSKQKSGSRRPASGNRPNGRGSGRRTRKPDSKPPRPGPLPKGEETGAGDQRLQKVLAAAGVASRRDCESLILEGRVEVDRQVVTALGTRVDPRRQEVRVDGELIDQPKLVYWAIHKPAGVVSTSRDPSGRLRVIDLLPPESPRAFCVGRLDRASEGLILATNDGDMANGLTHPRHGVEKVYHVHVVGQMDVEVVQMLRRGVHLAEGFAHAKYARIRSRRKRATVLEMVLDEGRNREIRRLLARAGHKVQRLVRVAVGPVRLGDLPPGAVRPLTRREVDALRRAIAQGSGAESEVRGRRPGKKKAVAKRRKTR